MKFRRVFYKEIYYQSCTKKCNEHIKNFGVKQSSKLVKAAERRKKYSVCLRLKNIDALLSQNCNTDKPFFFRSTCNCDAKCSFFSPFLRAMNHPTGQGTKKSNTLIVNVNFTLLLMNNVANKSYFLSLMLTSRRVKKSIFIRF